ncbi:adenine-specific methyltransferase EcoRI family protein [Campylobacter upsaliensis]
MQKVANTNLHDAKKNKKDEFYTQLSDIENELQHYKEHFKDKIVYCNCDDPLQSAFFEYFFKNFKWLDLKALITTCYKSQNYREVSTEDSPKKAYAIKIHRDDVIKDELINPQKHSIEDVDKVLSSMHPLSKVEAVLSLSLSNSQTQSQETLKAFEANKHKLFENFRAELESGLPKESTQKSKKSYKQPSLFPLDEDKGLNNAGDFRSKDCIELLKLADIVVTNPPFSLFREYVAQLVEYGEKKKKESGKELNFVILGNQNAITYKEIFKLIKENKLWLGRTLSYAAFKVPNYYEERSNRFWIDENGQKWRSFGNICWFTNLTHKKRNEILETIASYKKNPEQYPKYDNYDAINVDKTIEIPLDYNGIMGVPITFLDKHNPKQFEIVALGIVGSVDFTCNKKMEVLDKFGNSTGKFTFNAKGTLYRKFDPSTDKTPAFKDCESGELYSSIYARILIRKIAEVAELRKQEQEKM